MKHQQHYLDMMRRNPGASVGFSLAAKMVASSREGATENTWREIARDLKARYGESLTPAEVRAEMGIERGAQPGNQNARKHDQPERVNYYGSAANVARIREIGDGSFSAGVNSLLAHYDKPG